MEIYLVGGAVRDELLGRPVKERDWVVVGSTPEEMRALGYRQVGRDFPVFLHPETGEEYALARTERKTGPGHTGFVCHAGPEVTLEEDLARRDLTVNAMARDTAGGLIDPYGGAADLRAGVLRHVSAAFAEDPLRVFRVARFRAQLPGFEVAPETLALMRAMCEADALAELSAERVWQELVKALGAAQPLRFFATLTAAGALEPWLAEFAGVPLELPAGLEQPEARFAALCWDLTDEQVQSLCERLRAPRRVLRAARHAVLYGRTFAAWRVAPARLVLEGLSAIGVFAQNRDPDLVLAVSAACARVDLDDLEALLPALRAVSAARFAAEQVSGPALGAAIDDARCELIRAAADPV
ncbi:MAG: multifunctional CCA tRNA nucleotidyl transferase/2'3'-cyclic phosphodiesterase/2'nucleotidase/phosphatase [Pseudomonadales bacterium]